MTAEKRVIDVSANNAWRFGGVGRRVEPRRVRELEFARAAPGETVAAYTATAPER